MRRISILLTILITSFVVTLAGLVAGPIATASETETVRISASFSLGSSALTDTQKVAIKKAVTTSGTDATFLVTGAAGKLPGIADSEVQLLAKKRAQAVKSYLVKLGVSKSSVTIKLKITRLGIVPKTKIVGNAAVTAITATPVVNDTPAAAAPAPVVVLTCAAGGTCVVGDAGPGGGIVYYVDSSAGGFACGPTLAAFCNYLEVAPSGWNPVADPQKIWAVTANQSIDVSGIVEQADVNLLNLSTQIGLGLKNSIAIVTQNGAYNASTNNYAAGAARAYAGGTMSDWYLPTTAELNLLCQWGSGVSPAVGTRCASGAINSPIYGAASAGFDTFYYWSSSENAAGNGWYQYFTTVTANNGMQQFGGKFNTRSVRPVRAF